MNLRYVLSSYKRHISGVINNKFCGQNPVLKNNQRHRLVHKGEQCFILGSGHSILKQNLKLLKGKIVITQNHFHAHSDIDVIRPKYHCVVEKYQPDEADPAWIEWFESMEEMLPNDTVYFHGLSSKKLIDQMKLFVGHCYYIDQGLNPMFMRSASVDITRKIMFVPTVLTLCLTIALYMGFAKIYLIGFDLDQVCRMEDRDAVRFYGNSPITDNVYERSTEEYYAGTEFGWFNRWLMWKQYGLLRQYGEKTGQEIINLTRGGLLDCFKRKSYEEVVV